jgi:hypothetical protein
MHAILMYSIEICTGRTGGLEKNAPFWFFTFCFKGQLFPKTGFLFPIFKKRRKPFRF